MQNKVFTDEVIVIYVQIVLQEGGHALHTGSIEFDFK